MVTAFLGCRVGYTLTEGFVTLVLLQVLYTFLRPLPLVMKGVKSSGRPATSPRPEAALKDLPGDAFLVYPLAVESCSHPDR